MGIDYPNSKSISKVNTLVQSMFTWRHEHVGARANDGSAEQKGRLELN